jgi:hypothetical protein
MKLFTLAGALLLTLALGIVAGTPEEEKAFIDKYKAAMESKDTATLQSFLYTEGADPAGVELYKRMQSREALSEETGAKISKIELVNLTPEEVEKATTHPYARGGKVCFPLKITKKLIINVEEKYGISGSSSTSTETLVAEKDGKFVIPVPVDCPENRR